MKNSDSTRTPNHPHNVSEKSKGRIVWFRCVEDFHVDKGLRLGLCQQAWRLPQIGNFPAAYGIQVGCASRTFYSASTTGKLSDIMEQCTRHGFCSEINEGNWREDIVDVLDSVERYKIYDPKTEKVFARWDNGGWITGPD